MFASQLEVEFISMFLYSWTSSNVCLAAGGRVSTGIVISFQPENSQRPGHTIFSIGNFR